MNDRITLVALFNEEGNEKIKSNILIDQKNLCKVPYRDNILDRKSVDTLPYHFTFCAWDISHKEYMMDRLKNVKFTSKDVLINDIGIMNSINGGYVLYFNAILNEDTKLYQKHIYDIMPIEKYNPDKITFHITIHVDTDYNKLVKYKEQIESNFKPFKVVIENSALYEIYPAKLIEKY